MTAPGVTISAMSETDLELEQRLAAELGDDTTEPASTHTEGGAGDGAGGESESELAAAAAAAAAADEQAAVDAAAKRGSGRRRKPAASSEQQAETAQDQLARVAADYRATVAEIMADDFAMLIESPLDWIPGYLWHPDAVPIGEDVQNATMGLLFGELPPFDPATKRCELCNGHGRLRTHSRAEGNTDKLCADCGGAGWVANVATQAAGNAGGDRGGEVVQLDTRPPATGLPDAWQRPAGHPHWGLPPAEVGT